MVNQFLSAKQRRVDSGEMGRRSFADYHTACKLVVEAFGVHRLVTDLTPADFGQFRASLTKTRGPVALGNQINRVRSVFKFAFDAGLIEKPVRFGPEFIRPSMRAVRVAKRNNGPRLFEREEVHGLLKVASPALKAMILLGVNCGLGNTDIAELQRSMLDLKAGTLDFRRPKTGIARRGCLWPETIRAIRAYLKERREPVDDADSDTLFITKYGQRWVRVREPGEKSRRTGTSQIVVTDSVGLEFGKLVRTTNMQRPGRSFYALRHTFRTIADEVNDRRAIDLCMGHESTADIATAYVERIDEERIKRVAEHVRRWLYNEAHATENR
ncbi:MAG: tyrosine-type recombinase/integrase [Phycisphaerales bacterium]